MGDEATGAHDRILSDCDSLENGDVNSQPHVALQDHWCILTRAGIVRMPITVGNDCVGTAAHVVSDCDSYSASDHSSAKSTIGINNDL